MKCFTFRCRSDLSALCWNQGAIRGLAGPCGKVQPNRLLPWWVKHLTCDCFSQTWLLSYFPPWLDQWCETESLMCQTKMRRAEHKHSKKWKRMSKHVTVGSGYALTWPLMCCVVVSFVSSPPWSCWVSLFQRLILWTTSFSLAFNVPTCTQWCVFYNVLISSCGHYVCNFIITHTKQMHALAKQ